MQPSDNRRRGRRRTLLQRGALAAAAIGATCAALSAGPACVHAAAAAPANDGSVPLAQGISASAQVSPSLSLVRWLHDSLTSSLGWSSSRSSRRPSSADGGNTRTFKLAQSVHKGVHEHPSLIAWTPHARSAAPATHEHTIRTIKQRVTRARDVRQFLAARGQSLEQAQCATREALEWEDLELDAPDVSHRPTLLALATMASQAYENRTDTWQGYGGFNLSESFGWVEDGIRGHLFTTEDNSTVVVALKGTSAQFLPGGGDTAKRDKANDNLFFSCCCARVSWTWTPVCDCYQPGGKDGSSHCGQTCLERALVEKSFYYPAATDLYNNVSYLYPDSQIWITGHSLGGALSSLIGMTFGVPTVTFEAPGERMAAMRLHLPIPPPRPPKDSPVAELPITHVYHNADPLAVGDCTGPLSPCGQFGYAMESKCHAGKSIVYDTVGRLGWSSSLLTHRIVTLTDDLLTLDWDERVRKAAKGKAGAKGKASGAIGQRSDKERARRLGVPISALPPRRSSHDGGGGGGRLSTARWRWPWKKGDDDEDGGQEGEDDDLQPVPPRLSEDRCKDCTDWTFSDTPPED